MVKRIVVDGLKRTGDWLVESIAHRVLGEKSFGNVVQDAQAAQSELRRLGIFKNVEVTVDTIKGDGLRSVAYGVVAVCFLHRYPYYCGRVCW